MQRRISVLALLGLTVPVTAQSVLHEWSGPSAGPFYGSAVAAAGDVDGDGYAELLVGDPFGLDGLGLVELRSGRTAGRLALFVGQQPGSEFGAAVAGGADVDGDGLPDLVIGEPLAANGAGRVQVRSGADGALLEQFVGLQSDSHLGRAVALVGDLNADGFVDVCAGAPREGSLRMGGVHVWSGKDGTELQHWIGDGLDHLLGSAVAGLGDVDADGRPDVAGGAPQTLARPGFVDVWSGFDGVLLHHLEGDGEGDRFGAAVAGPGDVDGDGFADIAVGMPGFDLADPEAGGLVVYSGLTGGVLRLVLGFDAGGAFGTRVSAAGDVDNDGVLDVAGSDQPFFGGGVAVHSGSDGGQLLWLPALGEASFEALESVDVAGGFDLNTDGVADLALGVARRLISPDPGFARVVSTTELPWTSLPTGSLAGLDGAPFLDGIGVFDPGGQASLRLLDAAPLAATIFVVGFTQIDAPFKGGTLVPSPDLSLSGLLTGSDGALLLPTPLPSSLPLGTQLVYQAWVQDAGGPKGYSASNGIMLQDPAWLLLLDELSGDGADGQLGPEGKLP